MYKVFSVAGGHQIFWCPSAPTHYSDKVYYSEKVYPAPNNAHRQCKRLNLTRAFDAFLKSNDFKKSIIDSTKFSWQTGDGHFNVELFVDGSWRTEKHDPLCNKYETPGIVLGLPTLDCDEMPQFIEKDGTEEEWLNLAFANESYEIEKELKNDLYLQLGIRKREQHATK